jgi:ubiquinone/menaquinone biosynthesis C-methylase UbiE
MNQKFTRIDADSVKTAWDFAAEAYALGQASGRDYYRYEFLGPAQIDLCGKVESLSVLDLGCGAGYFAREMSLRGAKVVGVDISSRMIEFARKSQPATAPAVDYREADAMEIASLFPAEAFDLATSCLALQDMPDPAKVFNEAYTVLRPGGRFVTSITHPCSDTPYRAWERDAAGNKRWLCLDRYFDRGPFEYNWRSWAYDFETPAVHATLEDWFEWILAAGFQIRSVREPRPTREALVSRPDLEDATRMPYFLIFDLQR